MRRVHSASSSLRERRTGTDKRPAVSIACQNVEWLLSDEHSSVVTGVIWPGTAAGSARAGIEPMTLIHFRPTTETPRERPRSARRARPEGRRDRLRARRQAVHLSRIRIDKLHTHSYLS
jgi:hypothetical protein